MTKLVAYAMAGEPDKTSDLDYLRAILREADMLEIGIPFSDPVADGPTIERAHTRALARGVGIDHALSLVKALRAESDKPLFLMGYYNPILQRGLARFAREAKQAGVTGVIIPDLPLEESLSATAAGVELVQLASPATPPARLSRLALATKHFLYVVSSYGVTGAREELPEEAVEMVKRAKDACGSSLFAVGFGVSKAEHVRALAAAGAPAVVVGSAIVSRVEKGESPEQVAAFVRALRA